MIDRDPYLAACTRRIEEQLETNLGSAELALSKEVIAKYDLQAGKEPQKFGIGMKEIWEIDPAKHREGTVTHTMGWPLNKNAGGGSFIYHLDNYQVYVGFVVHLNYENPHLFPYMEFQRFKHHPMVADLLEGGKRVAYGARAISEGGYQSMPKMVAPGVAVLGCSVGMVNVPRIKGNHNAMLSGKAAAEAAYAAAPGGRAREHGQDDHGAHPDRGHQDREPVQDRGLLCRGPVPAESLRRSDRR